MIRIIVRQARDQFLSQVLQRILRPIRFSTEIKIILLFLIVKQSPLNVKEIELCMKIFKRFS
jgi:hypothetical protein